MTTHYGVTAVGNALVDVLAPTSDDFIAAQSANGMVKGAMMLIDTARANELYAAMGPATEMSGGSAANTMAVFAALGGRGGYIGKVADDPLGDVFAHDLKSQGIAFDTPRLVGAEPTGRCLILITPDAQRTMNTYLGAAQHVLESDVQTAETLITQSQYVYLEGYLFDRDAGKAAYRMASRLAHQAGRKVALTLSDTFCVDRHRADFRALVRDHVDLLFANESEIKALYETEDLGAASAQAAQDCAIVVITRSEQGSVILTDGNQFAIPAHPVDRVVDTTGAGDAYAGGFLYGLTHGWDMPACGALASRAASVIIAQMGPRPEANFLAITQRAA